MESRVSSWTIGENIMGLLCTVIAQLTYRRLPVIATPLTQPDGFFLLTLLFISDIYRLCLFLYRVTGQRFTISR